MRFLVNILLVGLIACNSNNVEKIVLLDSTLYTITEGSKIYGQLKINPNSGYVITRTFSGYFPSFSEQANCVVSIIGSYENNGDQICLVNQVIADIRFYNRWGQELTPTREDLERIESMNPIPETFSVLVNDKTLAKN